MADAVPVPDPAGAAFLLVGCGTRGVAVAREWERQVPARPVTTLCADGADGVVEPERFVEVLATFRVGGRVMLAGPRAAVWPLRAAADRAGLLPEELAVALVDDAADAPVYCPPCGAVQPVRGAPGGAVRCPGCGLDLDVDDHASAHLGAWMGVPADAPDAPGGGS